MNCGGHLTRSPKGGFRFSQRNPDQESNVSGREGSPSKFQKAVSVIASVALFVSVCLPQTAFAESLGQAASDAVQTVEMNVEGLTNSANDTATTVEHAYDPAADAEELKEYHES